jgi:hypothetical protein
MKSIRPVKDGFGETSGAMPGRRRPDSQTAGGGPREVGAGEGAPAGKGASNETTSPIFKRSGMWTMA